MMKLLTVLDIGEIIEEESGEVVATFDPTDENISQWEDWVEIINTHAKEYNSIAAQEE